MSTKKDNRKTGEASRKKKSALTRKPSAGRKSISRKKPAAGQKQSLKQKQTSGQKVFLIVSAAAAGCLCIVYLCVSFYFMKHFFPHTTINGQDFSGQTAEAAETFFKEQTESYSLTVIENENRTETIRGSEISLTCMEMDEIQIGRAHV